MTRLQHLVHLVNERGDGQQLPYVALEHIESGTGKLGVQSLPEQAASDTEIVVEPGDVLYGKLRPYLNKVYQPSRRLCASTELLAFRARRDLEPRFLRYTVMSRKFLSFGDSASYGVKMPRTSWELVRKFELEPPPLPTQRRIADFLDRETERIDALIDKKRRLIDLLEEKRTATITHAVTKGLDPTVPMKDSGIPWIGQIPAHWEEAHIVRLARLGSGHTPSRHHPEWWEDCTIPWITTGEVSQMRGDRIEYLTETRESISAIGLANSAAELHPKGTVVLSRTASAGFSAIMGVDMATSQDFVTWTCGPKLEPRFLLLCLRAMRRDLLERLAQGSTHQTIYMPDIVSIKIPVPPVEEQRAIVEWYWTRVEPIHAAIDKLNDQLGLLAEHREALITAAVTGEIDVETYAKAG